MDVPVRHSGVCVSVAIPNFNGMAHLPACLESLRAQRGLSAMPEIVIVDDASADASVSWLREHHPDVIVHAHEHNRGFAVTANDALRAASGDILFLLNNDTIVDPDCIARAMAFFASHPDAGWLACQLRLMQHPDVLDGAGDVYTVAGFPRARGKYAPAAAFDEPATVFSSCGAGVFLRRAVLDDVGLFDETYTSYQEDVDWGFRANLRGHTCHYRPECRVLHRMSASTGVMSPYIAFHTSRNIHATWLKNMPLPLLLLTAPLHAAMTALQGVWYLRGGRFREFLRGKLAFLRRIPSILSARAEVQRGRRIGAMELARRMDWRWFRTLIIERMGIRPPQ